MTEPEAIENRMCQFVFPGDTNHLGTLYGGTLMAWMDSAAAVAAVRRAGSAAAVTTAAEPARRTPATAAAESIHAISVPP